MAEITTPRLLLRPARAQDAERLFAVFGNPRAMRFWSTEPHASPAETEAFVAAMLAIPPGAGEDFVVTLDGAVIGKAGFRRFPEIGYILHPDHWGRGLAREALEAVIDRAFTHHRLPAIEADVDPRNTASLALLDRLGFAETARVPRTWFINREWCDSVYLRLARPLARPVPKG